MPGFFGEAEYSIDEKGRVALPAKWRRLLKPDAQDTFVITRGPDAHCLHLYPLDYWESTMDPKLRALDEYGEEGRRLRRGFVRWAEELKLDSQGRLNVSQRHLAYANLTAPGTALFVGQLDYLELWATDTFEDEGDDFATISARLLGNRS